LNHCRWSDEFQIPNLRKAVTLLEILRNAEYYNWRRRRKLKAQTKDSPLLEALKAEALKACF